MGRKKEAEQASFFARPQSLLTGVCHQRAVKSK